jgi:elongator complex protein 2
MKFSNNGNYLISVSRDRSYKLFMRQQNTPSFELIRSISTKNPYHTRIIWSCDWSHDDKYFITTSRDKRVCIWNGVIENDSLNLDAKPLIANLNNSNLYLELEDSVTACSFAPDFTTDNNYLVAVGLENGKIEFFKWNSEQGFSKFSSIEKRCVHFLIQNILFIKLLQFFLKVFTSFNC